MYTYKLGPELIRREMHSTIRSTADFLDNGILVNLVVGSTIVLVTCIFNPGIQGFLFQSAQLPSTQKELIQPPGRAPLLRGGR